MMEIPFSQQSGAVRNAYGNRAFARSIDFSPSANTEQEGNFVRAQF